MKYLIFVMGAIAPLMLCEVRATQAQNLTKPAIEASPQPATTVNEWLRQIAQASVAQITAVQLNPTSTGIEVILETAGQLEPTTSVVDDALIVDIPNAVLTKSTKRTEVSSGRTLTADEEFQAANPTEGIALVTATNLPNNRVRVAITGTTAPPTASVRASEGAIVLSVTASAAETANDEEEEIEIIVTGEQEDDNYFVPDASTATRTDTPLRDIPQSIQVIPEQVLEDQQVIRLDEALNNVSGVTFGGTTGNVTQNFNIRGFNNAPVLQDGFRQFGGIRNNFSNTTNLERIEVLKGPAAILYGQIEPGGAINLVTEQPLAEPFYEAELEVGNRELFRPQIDFSGPLTEDGRLRYRLNALYQHEDSFRNFDQDFERFFIAPVVSWQISDRTDLTVQFEYTDEEAPLDTGLVAVGNGVVDVPFERIFGESDDLVDTRFLNVGYNLEHRFSDNWRLRNAFRYTNQDNINTGLIPFGFDEDTGILDRFLGQQNFDIENYSLQTNVVGEFATGSIDHTLLFGVDLNRSDDREFTKLDSDNPRLINVFDPVYGASDGIDFDALPSAIDISIQADRLGIYLQDQIEFSDNLILLAGVRYDTVSQNTVNDPTDSDPNRSETNQNDDAWTPRVGIVYQPIPEISLYASYSQSFTPNTETTTAGDPLEPERGEGFEVGVKTELLEGRLAATLAYFDITRQNVATPDPNDFFSVVATGEQQSRGVELDVIGEILPGWNIIASYAYIDGEVTADTDPTLIGNRLFNAPEHSASLWTTYEIQQGDLQGLGFGVGFDFVGEREGDLANSFQVDSSFLTNAAIFYRRNNWRLALNVKNLFDNDYIAATNNTKTYAIEPGAPFTIIGSLSVQF